MFELFALLPFLFNAPEFKFETFLFPKPGMWELTLFKFDKCGELEEGIFWIGGIWLLIPIKLLTFDNVFNPEMLLSPKINKF